MRGPAGPAVTDRSWGSASAGVAGTVTAKGGRQSFRPLSEWQCRQRDQAGEVRVFTTLEPVRIIFSSENSLTSLFDLSNQPGFVVE